MRIKKMLCSRTAVANIAECKDLQSTNIFARMEDDNWKSELNTVSSRHGFWTYFSYVFYSTEVDPEYARRREEQMLGLSGNSLSRFQFNP